MSKSRLVFVVIFTIVVAVLVEVLFGNYLAARLATWPVVRRFDIFKPQAPIVVTNKEVVRVSDTQDTVDAVGKVKSRLASVAILQNGQLVVTGSAVALTGDGYLLSTDATFNIKGVAYFAVLNNGQSYPITALYSDPATTMVIFKINASGLNVSSFANSARIAPGQKLAMLANSATSFDARFSQTYVTASQGDTQRVFFSDQPSRSFGLQGVGSLAPGEVVITMDGEIAGMWDGATVMSSDVIRTATTNFFNNPTKFSRPVFGFYYRKVTAGESNTLSIPQGALVTKPDAATPAVVAGSPAATAGLQEGDIVIQLNDTKVDETVMLEELLEKTKPGDQVALTVVRNKKQVSVVILAGSN